MKQRYVIEFVRDGVVVRHYQPNFYGRMTKREAVSVARIFGARLPLPYLSWGKSTGWITRVLDRNTGLYVASYESMNRGGKKVAKLLGSF